MTATIDWFSSSPSAKKKAQEFINSDFMKFEENLYRATGAGDKFNARMDWNTLRSKKD